MEKKNQLRKLADYRDPTYLGAVAEFDWLPGYFLKLGPERIAGGEKLKKCIIDHHLDLLVVPEQSPYSIPETPNRVTELTMLCVAKKIEGVQGKIITLKQTQQLIILIKETGVGDLKWRNLVHCPNGQIALIDTECFWGQRLGLHSLLENNDFEPEAWQLLVKEVALLEGSPYKRSIKA
jgi:hypothetical protein